MNFPNLETERLVLSELTADDAEFVFELFSNMAVVEYYDIEVFKQRSQASQLIEILHSRFIENSGIRWAIRSKKTGAFIGTCGFNSWNSKMRNAVIGYDIDPKYWGNGFATESVHRIVKEAFSGRLPCGKLNRIQADTVPGNTASESVLKKVGFKEEGLRRQSGFWRNQFHDLKCFGLIKSEFAEA